MFELSTSVIVGAHGARYDVLVDTNREGGVEGSLCGGHGGLQPEYVAQWTVARWFVKRGTCWPWGACACLICADAGPNRCSWLDVAD